MNKWFKIGVAASLLLVIAACGRTTTPGDDEEPQPGLTIGPDSITSDAGVAHDFTFQAAGLPAGLAEVEFAWNFGDGSAVATGTETVQVSGGAASWDVTHTYAAEGVFGISVTVSEPEGDEIFSALGQAIIGDVEAEIEQELNVCDVWKAADSGGYGLTIHNWDISDIPEGATFDIQYDALLQPDRYIIEYPAGTVVHDTGWRGSSSYQGNPMYPGGIQGPGIGNADAIFTKGTVNSFKVTIIGGEPGTIWYYDIRCNQ